jgi:hypothetical protein
MKQILSKSLFGLAVLVSLYVLIYWLFNARLTQMELLIEKWPLWILACFLALLGRALS